MKSNLDLVTETDGFPYPGDSNYEEFMQKIYTIIWDDEKNRYPIGYMLEDVFNRLAKTPIATKGEIEVQRKSRELSIFQQSTETDRSKRVAATTAYWRDNHTFKVLDGWRDELYPIYGSQGEILYTIERSAASLFGFVTYGVHMTAFVKVEDCEYGMKLWVPRRAANKQTYGGMLDNTVAGGIASGEGELECLIREAEEEASLPRDLVRAKATFHNTVSYLHIRSAEAGGETGLIQPECQYVYDLELPPDVIPKPNDSEVQEFYLWTVKEVQEAMARGEFKPNCALVILDFFIRHGILTQENENDYEQIKRRVHRDLPFPGPHRG